MSNSAFWSVSGELTAVHGACDADPSATFGPWAADQRLRSGRLVSLSSDLLGIPAPGPGWHRVGPSPTPSRRSKPPRPCASDAPVATFAPALDVAAAKLLPPRLEHAQFVLRATPTWVSTTRPGPEEGPAGWWAALAGDEKASRFLVRMVPHRDRLPGDGWRNMLTWALRKVHGVRLVPLNGLPTSQALAAAPAWEYRVEAGRGPESAAWDVHILPSRRLLSGWAPGISDPWEATALLRWIRPGAPAPSALGTDPVGEPAWSDLLARLPAADARLLVQNVLNAGVGGAAGSAVLFYDTVTLPPGPDGRSLVRHVPQPGLPSALLSTLFGRRAWAEIERTKRFLPPEGDRRVLRAGRLADLDQRLAEGRLAWSEAALDLWQALYREPRHRALEARLASWRDPARWEPVLSGDPLVAEALLRSLDVTDAALCLRDAPDRRWRRFVTARREAEIREELEFCRVWDARGELTVERQLEAWEAWDDWQKRITLQP
ncbi:MAG TPA: hypothetical protein VMB23_03630 [Spirochaetia bacterium]|nr:hypothetical protein [Spirochaetia bacterium]